MTMVQDTGTSTRRGGIILPLAIVGGSLVIAELASALLPAMPVPTSALLRLTVALAVAIPLMILLSKRLAHLDPEAAQIAVAEPVTPEAPAPAGSEIGWDALRVAVFMAEKLSYFRTFSGALKENTESVIADTEGNAVGMMNQLRLVENGMEGLLSYITESNDGVVHTIANTEAQLARSRALIDEFSELRIRDAASVHSATEDIDKVVGDLGKMVQIVRGIARQTRMLAMNATIEAERAGEYGKGFAVVASEVKALSLQSDQATIQIGDGIEKLEAAVQDSLKTIVGERTATEGSGFAVISEAVGDMSQSLRGLISHQRDILTRVQHDNEQLAEPIMRMIGSIQFQDVVKRRLQGLTHAFDHITDAVDRAVSQFSANPDMSLEDMNTAIRTNLDEMVTVSINELQSCQSSESGCDGTHGPNATIELF
ncbi:MAG: chemotaxis protein [Rhodospirillum sp.]|nr:chemotaxis protein [Rhodospirillum sp.]